MRVAILTISDAGTRGQRADGSGDAAAEWATGQGAEVVARAIVPDDTVEIVRCLITWCDDDIADLVLTTGGTGLSARDVTPEDTRAVIESTGEVEHGCRVAFEIEKHPTGKRVCEGHTDYVLVTLATGRATPLPEDVKAKYSI